MKIVNRKTRGFSGELHPGITMHKIPVQAGFPGVVFTLGTLTVFLLGIAAFRYFLVFAIVLGIVFAVLLRFIPREAGGIAFVLTAVMAVFLAGIPAMDDWNRQRGLSPEELSAAVLAPPPPPLAEGELRFKCDCHQRQQPCDRTTQREGSQQRPQPPSVFDGTWEGKMNDLPGVNLIVADAGGGQLGGVVTFYFQMRDDERSKWRVAGTFVAPLLAAQAQGKVLKFEVQHHKTHGGREFGPNAKFRMELDGDHQAVLYNISEPGPGPVKLSRHD